MKRSILILVIISTFINFSCTIDDEPEESDVNLILGEWSGLGEVGSIGSILFKMESTVVQKIREQVHLELGNVFPTENTYSH